MVCFSSRHRWFIILSWAFPENTSGYCNVYFSPLQIENLFPSIVHWKQEPYSIFNALSTRANVWLFRRIIY